MSPKRIVEQALRRHIDIIAICDHNSADNVLATVNCAPPPLKVFPGMEITSIDEVHILALFDQVDEAITLQDKIYQHLLPDENNESIFGEQLVVNENDEIEAYNKRLLIGYTSLTLDQLISLIHQLNGIAIASHVDREQYGIINQLGFIPPELEFDALEISCQITRSNAVIRYPEICRYPLITSSDAHYLDQIGRGTVDLIMENPSIKELSRALQGHQNRKVIF
jgi:3',5'-nucleoside bisphosphate phosphatase